MWYVIQVMTGKEDEIATKLREQGIKALVPKENRLIRSGGCWTPREYILFTGYVFLNVIYNAENYYKIKNISGVIRFLGDKTQPSKLSYLEVEWITLLTGKDNTPIEPTRVRIQEDGSWKIVKGVLKNFEHRVIRYDKRNRKAIFEITICNEKKEVQLSILLENEEQEETEKKEEVEEQEASG